MCEEGEHTQVWSKETNINTCNQTYRPKRNSLLKKEQNKKKQKHPFHAPKEHSLPNI